MQSDSFYVLCRVVYAICWSLTTTLSLVYMVVDARLDPLQMLLVGAVLEGSVFLFEIPTGVMADTVSRRLSVIVGMLLMGTGFILFAAIPEFYFILLAQVVWGIGATFISGAWPAWLSGEVGVERAGRAFVTGSQYGHVGALFGIGLAIVIGYETAAYSILVGGVGFIGLGLLMLFGMREDGFEPTQTQATWKSMNATFRHGITTIGEKPLLVMVLVVTCVFGAFSEGWDRLFTPFVLEEFELPAVGSFDGVVWWGILAAVAHVVGFASTTIAKRRVRLEDDAQLGRTLALLLTGVSVGVVLVVQIPSFYAVIGLYWLIGAFRSAYGPLLTAWLNRLIPERNKATMFSMYGQADAFGQVAGGPAVGLVAKHLSIGVALMVSALVLLPAQWILRRQANKG